MIYLVGGPPRCGKTTIAKLLASRLSIPWVTADMLESVVEAYAAKEHYEKLFPKNVIRQATHQSNDEMYTKYSTAEIVNAYIEQAKTTWRAIEVLVEHAQKFNENIVIDGHQLHPEFIDQFLQTEGGEKVRSVIVLKKDVDLIIAGAKENQAQNDWFLQKTKNENILPLIAGMLKKYGEFFEEQAEKHQLKTFIMDTNFQRRITDVVEFLVV